MAATNVPLWRPASEAEAASDLAALVEWLRATGRMPDATPERLRGLAPDALEVALEPLRRAGAGPPLRHLLQRVLPEGDSCT